MKKATPALLLAGLALSASLQAQAAEAQAAVGTENAVMVGIDAKTGHLRPLTANEAKALAARAANMPRGRDAFAAMPRTEAEVRATVRRHANGGTSARAPMSSMSEISVTRDASGRLQAHEGTVGQAAPAAAQQEVTE